MAATLLETCQAASRLLKLDVPSSVYGATDETSALLWALADRGGKALMKRFAWQRLLTVRDVASDGTTTLEALPADFDRLVPETVWNLTRQREIFGPLDPQEWALSRTTTWVDPAYMIRGNTIYLTSAPTAADQLSYTYVRNTWVVDAASSTPQAAYTSDSDTTVFDDELLVLDVMWRFRQNKGLEFEADRYEFERRLADCISNDGSRRRLGPATAVRGPNKLQIPDTLTALIGS